MLYLGQVVELGLAGALFDYPAHPYTRALLSSIPAMDPERRTEKAAISGDPPNPINPPSGCRFHTRCPLVQPVCSQRAPALGSLHSPHPVACLMYEPGSGYNIAAQAAAAA